MIEEFEPITITMDGLINAKSFEETIEYMVNWSNYLGLQGMVLSSVKIFDNKIECKVIKQSDLCRMVKSRSGLTLF